MNNIIVRNSKVEGRFDRRKDLALLGSNANTNPGVNWKSSISAIWGIDLLHNFLRRSFKHRFTSNAWSYYFIFVMI